MRARSLLIVLLDDVQSPDTIRTSNGLIITLNSNLLDAADPDILLVPVGRAPT